MTDYQLISGNVRISVITQNLIRIEQADEGNFVDDKTLFAINREFDGSQVTASADDTGITVTTPYVTLTYVNDQEPLNKTNLYAHISTTDTDWYFGKKSTGNLGGTRTTLDYIEPTAPVQEGLLSTEGWYVIDESRKPVLVDEWIAPRNSDSITDIYLFAYGKDYLKALQSLSYVSGKAALPRKYIFGSWFSRWWQYTQEEIIGIVDGYDQNDFPLDILVIDMDWHYNDWTFANEAEKLNSPHAAKSGHGHAGNLGWTGYSWNRDLIPEPQKLLDELHQRNIHVTLNDHPADGVRSHEDCYERFAKEMGFDADKKIELPYDASDRKYINAIFKSAHTPLEESGIDFWWVDWQQNRIMPYVKTVPGTRHLPWLNYLYYEHSQKNGKRGLGFSRWGGWGDQKRPIQFSGDTLSSWEMLQYEVKFNITSSNSACLYWAHDLGGFYGDRNPEMFVRWVQFGLTNATLRVHSQRDEALDRCPWKWGEQEGEAMRRIYHLRARLIPYIYSVAYKSYETSLPFIRGMYMAYPEDERAYQNMQQYFFGDAFIAAPITSAGTGERMLASQKVWLKEGDWYSLFDGKKYTGDAEYEIECDLMSFPLLVRGGMPIPMQPYSRRMTSQRLDRLEILCYPGKDGESHTFTLYEDDGISTDYQDGKYLKTDITYTKANQELHLTLTPYGDGYPEMEAERTVTIILPQTEELRCISHADVKAHYDVEQKQNTFVIEHVKTDREITLKLA